MLIPALTPEIPKINIVQTIKENKPKIDYTVQDGDSLTTIAEQHSTSVLRLWAANTQLTNPDQLEAGIVLKVPLNTDVLPDRPMPSIIRAVEPVGQTSLQLSKSGGFSNSGNTYYWGQCVWYVKNHLSWVQNGWGNASDWKYTSGHPVSAIPAVSTVAWAKTYGHVAIVTAVGDGTVTISEMNYEGVGVESSRTAPISEFEYIYP